MRAYELLPYLDAIRAHLVRHRLPAPVTVECTTWREPVTVHLEAPSPEKLVRALLAWSHTLQAVTTTVVRTEPGRLVHLTVRGRNLSGIWMHVWGVIEFHPALFPGLAIGEDRDVGPLTLQQWRRGEWGWPSDE